MFVRQQSRAVLRALPLSCNHKARGEERFSITTINECNLFCPLLLTSIYWLCFPLLSLAVHAECWISCPGSAMDNWQCWSFLGEELGTCQTAGPASKRGCNSWSVMPCSQTRSCQGSWQSSSSQPATAPGCRLPQPLRVAALCPPGQQELCPMQQPPSRNQTTAARHPRGEGELQVELQPPAVCGVAYIKNQPNKQKWKKNPTNQTKTNKTKKKSKLH